MNLTTAQILEIPQIYDLFLKLLKDLDTSGVYVDLNIFTKTEEAITKYLDENKELVNLLLEKDNLNATI
ncbi:MAG: hypothetical protein AABY22_21185 [Nanoarchaeota archaeon]